jgi:transcriptional regulator with XRE-family HTH domain
MATNSQKSMPNEPSLAEKIRHWRRSLGMTQERLEQVANLGHNSISRIEKSEVSPRLETVEKIANAMGISLEELHFGKPRLETRNSLSAAKSDLEQRISKLEEPMQSKARELISGMLDLLEGQR